MAPQGYRALQRSALQSRKLAALADRDERLYVRLILAVDPFGVMSADPIIVKAEAAPRLENLTVESVSDSLLMLERAGLIVTWDDGETDRWLHITGFDNHQTSEFKRKRGRRRSPKPPQVERTSPPRTIPTTMRGPGTIPPLDALRPPPEPRTKNLEPRTNTTSSPIPNDPGASAAPPAHTSAAARPTADHDGTVQETRNAWLDRVCDHLTFAHNDDPGIRAWLHEQVWMHQERHAHRNSYPKVAYERAATALASKYDEGWRPREGGSLIAYYLSTIPSHAVELELPKPEPIISDTVRWMRERRAQQEAVE